MLNLYCLGLYSVDCGSKHVYLYTVVVIREVPTVVHYNLFPLLTSGKTGNGIRLYWPSIPNLFMICDKAYYSLHFYQDLENTQIYSEDVTSSYWLGLVSLKG